MDVTPLISVIVPIYNVEKYVKRCLDSLKNQTMRKIEVICIDDGSTDESGRIADEFAKVDARFRVIHTENRGLSAARNRGIDETRADWIMFVDSDDWVDSRFCEIPWSVAKRNKADLVIFESFEVKRNTVRETRSMTTMLGIIDESFTHVKCSVVVWNKIYKKELFAGICYPDGRVCEDVATTPKLVHNAARIVRINDCLYYHCWRKDSISNRKTAKTRRDWAISAWERYENLKRYGVPDEDLRTLACSAAIGIMANKDMPHDCQIKASVLLHALKRIPKNVHRRKRMAIRIWQVTPALFYFFCTIIERIRRIQQLF